MIGKCSIKVGETRCKQKYCCAGYCKSHYEDKFKINKKRMDNFAMEL